MSVKKASWEERAEPSRGWSLPVILPWAAERISEEFDLLEGGGSVGGVRASAAMLIGTAVCCWGRSLLSRREEPGCCRWRRSQQPFDVQVCAGGVASGILIPGTTVDRDNRISSVL